MAKLLAVLLLFVQVSLQQKNPISDFCRRFGHQTAVVDQKLYIDGGMVDWNPISANPANYTNTWLLYNDLTTSPIGVGVPQLYANLSKNASIPDVSGGTLWADSVNKRFFLYGGDYSGITPNTPNLISYDILYNQWEYFGPPNVPIQSVSWAGSVGISELGQGYSLGGWLSNASIPGWTGDPLLTSSLIQYDMNQNVWTNTSGPDTIPKGEGVMVYIPASNDGLLVYFGGIVAPYENSTTVPLPMSTIYVYDIQSSKWYTQTATGGVPLSRRRFCAGAAWAADKSSYNIYLYGGLGFGANAAGFDDLYILSLPTFTWIPWWQSSGVGVPHHSLTCNVVGGQMLIIGGTFPLTEDCDSPATWGTHNVDLGKVSGHMWNTFQTNETNSTSYVVPPEVIAIVGGNSLGGATATAPSDGFGTGSGDLAVYFGEHASVASRTPTRPIPSASNTGSSGSSKSLPTGAIAGIAVGSAVVLLALALGCCCFIRQHRRRSRPQELPAPYPGQAYPKAPYIASSPYSPQGIHYQPVEAYQLPAPVPVELAENAYSRHDPVKSPIFHASGFQETPPLQHSPLASPHLSTYSHATTTYSHPSELSGTYRSDTIYGSQVSPSPTYSSVGRAGLRKPVPPNQTYYSP